MPRKPRIHYTETDKALMWDRWREDRRCRQDHSAHQESRREKTSILGEKTQRRIRRPPAGQYVNTGGNPRAGVA